MSRSRFGSTEGAMYQGEILITAPVEQRLDAALAQSYVVHRLWLAHDKAAFLASIADRVRVVVTRSVIGADRALMTALPKLELIAIFGVGLDAIDFVAARERGIRVTNTPDVLTADTADYGIALLLALARKIVAGDRFVRQGKWQQGLLPNSTRVHGKRLGIVGLGRIGEGVARRAAAFSLDVSYTGPRAKPGKPWTYVPSLVALARQVDFLVLTCPGGPETSKIVNAEVLRALGPEAFLINIARASVVDHAALIAALANGTIKGAALDVFENEPEVPAALLGMDNVILEPHIASTTVETRAAIGDLVLANVAAHLAGEPLPSPVEDR
ncbi:MAG TPA: 2-hydroxyacid dehydrogenase [Povalibacter sp.]|nr:2-hydroxyacid dehydrogenase [Povalibacter sp.]